MFLVFGVGLTAFAGGVGLFIGILLLVVIAILLILLITAYIKVWILYIKLIFSTVTSPLTFAFSAIPGNEHMINDWFKSYLAKALSIPAMFFGINVSLGILAEFLNSQLASAGDISDGGGEGFGILFALIAGPLIAMWGLKFCTQIPAKIEAMIVGQKR